MPFLKKYKYASLLIAMSCLLGFTLVGKISAQSTWQRDLTFNAAISSYLETHPYSQLALQPDGKILTIGYNQTSKTGFLRRLNVDGSIDLTFNCLFEDHGSESVWRGQSLLVLDNNKIILFGRIDEVNGVPCFGIVRLNENGSLDGTFSLLDNGLVHSATQQSGGKLVVGVYDGTNYKIVRLNTDGTLDSSFLAPTSISSLPVTNLLTQNDQNILVFGSLVKRVNPNGQIDPTYANNFFAYNLGLTYQTIVKGSELVSMFYGGSNNSLYHFTSSGVWRSDYHYFKRMDYVWSDVTQMYDWAYVPALANTISILADASGLYVYAITDGDISTGGAGRLRQLSPLTNSVTPPGILPSQQDDDGSLFIFQADGKILVSKGYELIRYQRVTSPNLDPIEVLPSNEIRWKQAEATPATHRAIFKISYDSGASWNTLGEGIYTNGSWRLNNVVLPIAGHIKAVGVARHNGSESVIESLTVSGSGDIEVTGNNQPIVHQSGAPSPQNNTDYGDLIVSNNTQGLGYVTKQYQIKNTGLSPLIVSNVQISGANAADFTLSALSLPVTLSKGQTLSFGVTFNPSAIGNREATITVTSDDPFKGSFAFSVKGNGIEPTMLIRGNGYEIADSTPVYANLGTDFGTPSTAAGKTSVFKIQSVGLTPLRINQITSHSPVDFQVTAPSLPIVINPGNEIEFSVTFKATVNGEKYSGISISNNTGFGYALIVRGVGESSIKVTGNGQHIVKGDVTPSVTDGTDFGDALQAQRTKAYVIENNGGAPLNVTGISLSGTHASNYSISGINFPVSIPAGESRSFSVTLGLSPIGLRSAKVTIASNDPNRASYDFNIQGQGVPYWKLPTQTASYPNAGHIPITSSDAVVIPVRSTITLSLGFAPPVGTNLTLIKSEGLQPIVGSYSNLQHGQEVALTYNGLTYAFIANYHGGRSNDLVLHWLGNKAFAWGNNNLGRLGINSTTNTPNPTHVNSSLLNGKTIISVAGGGRHTLALTSEGKVYSWGANGSGQLGNGTTSTTATSVPVAVTGLSTKIVTAIAAGYDHSLALCSDGALYAWGLNSGGQLGNGTVNTGNQSTPVLVDATSTSSALRTKRVVRIASGSAAYHSLALCSDGTLVAWGRGNNKCLGNDATANQRIPVLVLRPTGSALVGKQVIGMSAGLNFSLALCSDGTIAAWGANAAGRLGIGTASTTEGDPKATLVASLLGTGQTITAITAGDMHGLALRSDGSVISWGEGASGKLGIGSTANSLTPQLVSTTSTSTLNGKTVTSIGAGEGHSLALCSDGTLHSWGLNSSGQLGIGTTTGTRTLPGTVLTGTSLPTLGRIVAVESAYSHAHLLYAEPQSAMIVEHPFGTSLGSSGAFNFGKVFYGSGVTAQNAPLRAKTIYIRNIGTATLTGINVSITGSGASQYSVSGVPVSVTAGAYGDFTVTFNPTANGTQSASLTLTVGSRTFTASLTGIGDNTIFSPTFYSGYETALTATTFDANGKSIDLTNILQGAMPYQAILKVVDVTGSGYINGFFSNLPDGEIITLSYGSSNYEFAVNYTGGTGNDLVLEPLTAVPSASDNDGDLMSNGYEYLFGTNPGDKKSFMLPVVWQDLQNTTTSGTEGGLSKSGGGSGWSADAVGNVPIYRDGTVSFSANQGSVVALGLSADNPTRDLGSFTHAIVTNGSSAHVYEGSNKFDLGPYGNKTLFTIKRVGQTVEYYRNRKKMYTSSLTSTGTVFVDTSFSAPTSGPSSTLSRVFIFTDDLDNDGMLDSWEYIYAGLNAVWSDVVNFTASGDADGDGVTNLMEFHFGSNPKDAWSFLLPVHWESHRQTETQSGGIGGLKKTSYPAGETTDQWDSDAVSKQKIMSQGWVSFRLSENNEVAMGLSAHNSTAGYQSINYAIVTDGANNASVYQNGAVGASLGSYTSATWFKIELLETEVKYYKSGILLFTASRNETGMTFVDSSFKTLNGSILEAHLKSDDQDEDGMKDAWEKIYITSGTGLPALIAFRPEDDLDHDGLTNLEEYNAQTHPINPDTDGDGLNDGWEVQYGMNPNLADENQNGIIDGVEDFDGDGLTNAQEFLYGTNPFNIDTDGDRLPDGWELATVHGSNSFNPLNADQNGNAIRDDVDDFDGDGLTNYQEYLLGTNPWLADSDGNGINDKDEFYKGTPSGVDSDDDGVSDEDEIAAGTDPEDWLSTPYVQLQVTTPIR
jgi:uncharacterized delta-60 repeat protein